MNETNVIKKGTAQSVYGLKLLKIERPIVIVEIELISYHISPASYFSMSILTLKDFSYRNS
jgi:hypothetical protein